MCALKSNFIHCFIYQNFRGVSLKRLEHKISHFQFTTQPAFTCTKLTIETLEQGVKYVQS